MKVEVNILVENTTPAPGFVGEFGFAAVITVEGKKFLFDTGLGNALKNNAAMAGIDLAQIDDLIISHGHFDHTGAVLDFLATGKKKIYAHSNIFVKRYAAAGDFKKEVGVPFPLAEIEAHQAQIIYTDDFTEICPGVFLTGVIPRITGYEDVGGNFLAEKDGELVPDILEDDMAMVIDHPDGLIIIDGCAHAGIINTIEYARSKTGKNKVRAFIGGTHLITASEERIKKTADVLRDLDVQQIIPCHCTGFNATAALRHELGERVIKGETAMGFTF
ncbi:MAG TPA: MBL fold metallo-hydrolase [Syntrophomonadaceae bacterium]|nr:MBL fold metallo-hydrolase [Syntrophomonadaceae bacterium]HRX22066.1 MBL fold metallo-hydrolase [Syntrophomonadaceae bacterium]